MLLATLTFSLACALPQDSAAPASTGSPDWPWWRGAARDGVSTETGWSPHGVPLWSVDVGYGYSCPSIAGDTLYAVGFDLEREVDVVRALDTETGVELWRDEYPAQLRAFDHEGGSLATPTVADGRLFVINREGEIRSYDAETGKLLWFKDMLAAYDVPPDYYGYASSPVVVDDLVVFNCFHTFALDARTGDLVWRAEVEEANWSTPAPFELSGEASLAVFTQQGLHVVALATGEEQRFFPWHKSDRLVNAATPIDAGAGRIFLSSAYDHGCALVDFAGEEPRELWANRQLRSKMAGGVLTGGHVYGFDESMLKCLSIEDGALAWRVRGLGNGSLVAGDGKLVMLSSKGELIVAEASEEEFRELSRETIFDDGGVYWAPPVIADGRIYAKSNRGLLVARDHRAGTASSSSAEGLAATALPEARTLFEAHLEHIGGAAAVRAVESLHAEGTFEMRSVGFRPVALELDRRSPDLWRVKIGLPPPRPGHIERMYDGELAYEVNQYLGHSLFEDARTLELADALHLHGAADWASLYPRARTAELVPFGDRPCHRVEVMTRNRQRRSLYFDVETGFLAGRDGEGEDLVHYGEYREFEGLLLPTLERRFVADTGIEEVYRIEEVIFGGVGPERFERPAEIHEFLEERESGSGD